MRFQRFCWDSRDSIKIPKIPKIPMGFQIFQRFCKDSRKIPTKWHEIPKLIHSSVFCTSCDDPKSLSQSNSLTLKRKLCRKEGQNFTCNHEYIHMTRRNFYQALMYQWDPLSHLNFEINKTFLKQLDTNSR